MSQDLPRPVLDYFLVHAALQAHGRAVSNPEAVAFDGAEPRLSIPTDDLVRTALDDRYAVSTAMVGVDGQLQVYEDLSWAVPRNLVLQFSTVLRFILSGEVDGIPLRQGSAFDPAQVIGMAEAWALRQGLFQDDDAVDDEKFAAG